MSCSMHAVSPHPEWMKMGKILMLMNLNYLAAILTADNYGALAHNLYMDLSTQFAARPPMRCRDAAGRSVGAHHPPPYPPDTHPPSRGVACI